MIHNYNYSEPKLGQKFLVIITTLSILIHTNGEALSVGGIAISNFFVLLLVLPNISRSDFIRRFPRSYALPLALLVTTGLFGVAAGSTARAVQALQALFFLLLPYCVHQRGLSQTFVKTAFLFILASQIWLLSTNGFTLPADDLGGFFVSRRTVHSLALGAFALLFLSYIRREGARAAFLAGITGLLLISQARGAAALFLISSLAFGRENFAVRWRIYALVMSMLAIALTLWWQRDLLVHFSMLLSTTGGSSTGYRLYLLEILISEFDRYWLFGMTDDDIQYLISDQLNQGKIDVKFALDNSFSYLALKSGLIPLIYLIFISVRMACIRKAYPIYFVGWLILDDILGSAMGWLLMGQAMLAFRKSAKDHGPTP